MRARREAGYQLHKVQYGDDPTDWRPLRDVGTGVREIRIRDSGDAYRVVYVANRPDAVYVLHAFQKKPRKTPVKGLALARQRFQQIGKK